MNTEIYLDGNATSAVMPSASAAAMAAMNDDYGNPSSSHSTGLKAKAIMDKVRACALRLLGVGTGRLMFNSGATEGIQTAVLSALHALRERRQAGGKTGSLLIYGATEHKAVPESLAHWNRVLGLNLELRVLPVGHDGRHDLDQLAALAPQAALVCTMAANNETGIISDIGGIERVLTESCSEAYWLVDCVQALGKLSLDLAATRIDYAPFSGHKLYAPKGIGMLYVREGAPFTPLMVGGGQEAGLRSGTENMAGIAALGAVLAESEGGTTFRSHEELSRFRDQVADSLRAALPGLVFNAEFDKSLPTTLNFAVPWLSGKELLNLFDAANVRVSAGSACSAAKAAPSYVLQAMNLEPWQCEAAIRLSFGPLVQAQEIDAACRRIEECGRALHVSCLTPNPEAETQAACADDSVVRFSTGGANTWVIADRISRECVIVDPQAASTLRVHNYIQCRGYTLRAVLRTNIATQKDVPIRSVRLGEHVLVGVEHGAARMVYLLGNPHLSQLAPRLAFIGQLRVMDLRPGLVGIDTLLCPGTDEINLLCTTLRAENRLSAVTGNAAMSPQALAKFLDEHPDALLVDVREYYEQVAGAVTAAPWGKLISAPLSHMVGKLDAWLAAPRSPLLFFCRSGERSVRAAACLRRLGHESAWSVTGGAGAVSLALKSQEVLA